MRVFICCSLFLCSTIDISAQETPADSTRLLREVVVEAYATDRPLNEVPAAIGYIPAADLQRFSTSSILPAVNVVPGVRMEERSPGSYRFSIRGSSLRSPFGVRNVKVYWNGFPLTDGGGNTYLNLLDQNAIGSMEIIKGPGGSLYGAGTGGVIIMKSPAPNESGLRATAIAGNYGLRRYILGGDLRAENVAATVQYAHHRSFGYRDQTAMKRNALNADLKIAAGKKGTFLSSIFFTDLLYETPGGLTQLQFDENPRQARPPSASLGAVEAKAAVTNQTIFGGISYAHQWSESWSTTAGIYGGSSAFENPTIRNYENRDETNLGFRSTTEYIFDSDGGSDDKLTLGVEFQHFGSPIQVYNNDQGSPGAVQVRDEVSSNVGLVFAQIDFRLPLDFFLTAGGSLNFLRYNFTRLEPVPVISQTRNFESVFSPRLAVLKKFSDHFSIYSSYSNGFSPPSLAEVRPSTNTFSNDLKSETGKNLELGAKGTMLAGSLQYDLTVYDFRLNNTIVVQRNAEGADYFINAGKTAQRGIEALVSVEKRDRKESFSGYKAWVSYAYQHYRFKQYMVLDVDFSGNKLTGIAPTIFTGGVNLEFRKIVTASILFNYVDHIPLDDANTVFASEYFLLGARVGYKTGFRQKNRFEFFAGVDNALDETYSLGNDLNAFGGRYFNAAMPRNYYAGISLFLGSQK